MLSWKDEMGYMLSVIERQVKCSLGKIELTFKRDGLSFDDEFKQYFMWASNHRIEETYVQFNIDYLMKNKVNVNAEEITSLSDEPTMINSIHGPVEIVDSSDDDGDQPGYRIKLELLEELAAIQNGYDGAASESIDADHFGDNGRSSMKALEMEVDDEIPIVAMDARCDIDKINTSTVTLKEKSNTASCSKNHDKKEKSTKRPKAMSDSIAETLPNSQNQLETKKRFKDELRQKVDFNRHLHIHAGEKPYQCDICRKGFSQLMHMKRHKVTHTNEIPFYCRGCFTGFSQKAERDAHDKVCKNRRYECHLCKKFVTANKIDLKRHMQTHIGEKPYRCGICLKHFSQKSSLKRHLDAIHI